MGQYWCHILEACVPTTSPCGPYSAAAGSRSFALPPRYLAFPPFYHLVADLPLRINPSSELKTLSVSLPLLTLLLPLMIISRTVSFNIRQLSCFFGFFCIRFFYQRRP